MPDCEICGKYTEEVFQVLVEGSKMNVCNNCSGSGKFLGQVREAPVKKETVIEEDAPDIEIVDNYGVLIRDARERKGYTQEEFAKKINESFSLLQKIELEKIQPNERAAEKIEKVLGIKIYQLVKRQSMEMTKKKTTLTMADVIKIKEKKKMDE